MQLRATSGRPLQVLVVIALVALAVAGVTSPAMARSVKKKHKTPYVVSESVSRRSGTPGMTVTVTGKVSPKAKGRKVTLQVRRGRGGWVTTSHETLPRASTYSLRAKLASAATYGLRTVIGKSKKHAAGVSATRTVSVVAPVLHTWRQLAAGSSHTCGIKTDGSLWCWGWNVYGQIGSSTGAGTNKVIHTPVRIGARRDWRQVTSGDDHSCALAADHSVWCWGSNAFGQLGTSTHAGGFANPTPTPQHVAGSWTSVSAGDIATCAIKTGGTAWCWGSDEDGALGNGTSDTNLHAAPVQVIGSGWSSVSAGQDGACGIKTDHGLWCWGDNNYGQLASTADNGTDAPHATPLHIGSDTWNQVASGGFVTCGIKTTGTAWCWGYNRFGELGNASNNGFQAPNPTPTQVGDSTSWVSLSEAGFHTCGRQSSGAVSCWGWNYYGELGRSDNTANDNANPTPMVVGDSTMTMVTAGGSHSCGIRPGGKAVCWGDNDNGELGSATNAGNPNPNVVPLAVG